ncbi:MAG: hypothetical protein ACTS6P_00905 [Candidatus Hodgkinia cicadicola]
MGKKVTGSILIAPLPNVAFFSNGYVSSEVNEASAINVTMSLVDWHDDEARS